MKIKDPGASKCSPHLPVILGSHGLPDGKMCCTTRRASALMISEWAFYGFIPKLSSPSSPIFFLLFPFLVVSLPPSTLNEKKIGVIRSPKMELGAKATAAGPTLSPFPPPEGRLKAGGGKEVGARRPGLLAPLPGDLQGELRQWAVGSPWASFSLPARLPIPGFTGLRMQPRGGTYRLEGVRQRHHGEGV